MEFINTPCGEMLEFLSLISMKYQKNYIKSETVADSMLVYIDDKNWSSFVLFEVEIQILNCISCDWQIVIHCEEA